LYPVSILCAVLGVSKSGFYAWKGRPPSSRTKQDARLAVEVAATHKRTRGVYGSPRVHAELKARGVRASRKCIARLMRKQGLRAWQKRKFRKTTDSDSEHVFPVAPNVLARDFETSAPNQAWVADVTFVSTHEGWLYLAVVINLFARRVVGWATSAFNGTELVLDALRRAVVTRKPGPGLVHHSDRGSTYASDEYRRALEQHELVASMSRKGDCWDNAVADSFFATLRAELLDHARIETREHGTRVIGEYIESFYNPVRRHSHLDYASPIEFELRSAVAAFAA